MWEKEAIIYARNERQFLASKADQTSYLALYRDMQPGQNVYWNGFGDPPSLTFRAEFNDIEFNRQRQANRSLVKGRFAGGNIGWIVRDDLELFGGLYRKPLEQLSEKQLQILELIECEGPLNIQLMKDMTGLLVKEITPILHRLQEAFLIYEDQYNGEWDRGWYKFNEMFPDINLNKYSRINALKIILRRFAFRHVHFDLKMAKSFYKLPAKEIKMAIEGLIDDGILIKFFDGYILQSDLSFIERFRTTTKPQKFVLAMHRNDFLVKSNEHKLKEKFKHSEYDTLQYILIDGEFHGASVGHFRNGPYDLEDIILDLPKKEIIARKDEILEAIYLVNYGKSNRIKRYCGEAL